MSEQDPGPLTHDGRPYIERIHSKMAALERRLDKLDERIDGGQGSDASLGYDRAERKAIKEAVRALRWLDAIDRDLDTPILALAELVDAIEDDYPAGSRIGERTMAAYMRARRVAREWSDGE